MRMYEEHAMSAIYMDAEMSHHGDPGNPDSTESYHPGLVVEQLNKVFCISCLSLVHLCLPDLLSWPCGCAQIAQTILLAYILCTHRRRLFPIFVQRLTICEFACKQVGVALRS